MAQSPRTSPKADDGISFSEEMDSRPSGSSHRMARRAEKADDGSADRQYGNIVQQWKCLANADEEGTPEWFVRRVMDNSITAETTAESGCQSANTTNWLGQNIC